MNTLKPLNNEQASIETQHIFAEIKSQIGMVPNLYAAMGISDKLLGGYLKFVETLKLGEFSDKEYATDILFEDFGINKKVSVDVLKDPSINIRLFNENIEPIWRSPRL